jgi:hypothetical protein
MSYYMTSQPINMMLFSGLIQYLVKVRAKGAAGGDQHTVAVARWDKSRCVSIAERVQSCPQPRRSRAPAIFGKNQYIGVLTLERVGNSGQPGSAALPDVPGD